MSSWLTTMKKVNLKSQGTLCRIIGNKKGLGKVFGGGEALARIEARKWNQDGNHLWAFSPGHVSELVSSFCFYRPSILLCTNQAFSKFLLYYAYIFFSFGRTLVHLRQGIAMDTVKVLIFSCSFQAINFLMKSMIR